MAKPIPFIGAPGQRATGETDQRYVNVLFEVDKNPTPGSFPVNCLKRPGLSTSTQPAGGAATGRGIYHWSVTGDIYSVFGGSTFVNTSTLVSSMTAGSGRVWFTPIHNDTGTAKLMVSDGAVDYQITSTNVVSTMSTFGSTQHTASAVELDGFWFHLFPDGKLRNTAVNTVSTWGAAAYLTLDTYGTDAVAIHRQKDQIIGFTKNRIEFFFNNGNPTNSPLLRIDQNTIALGLAHKNSLSSAGETACFVSENPGDGGLRSVYMIQSLGKVSEIADSKLKRFLNAEGLSISSCTSWMETLSGQLVYHLNLASANRSFQYGIDSGLWAEAEDTTSTKLNIVAATSKNGEVYAQHATDGRIYTFQPAVYQDNETNFEVVLQTSRSNYGSGTRKYEADVQVIGDTSTGTLYVDVSDNDFTGWTTVGEIDMSKDQKRATRLGAFYARAHRFRFQANAPLRLQAFIPGVRVEMS